MIDFNRLKLVFCSLFFITGQCTLIAQHNKLYVGTYTITGDNQGVQIFDFNTRTGQSTFKSTITMSNPSFLAVKGDFLYAVNEESKGRLTAVDLKTNKIINSLPTQGAHPCHVALSPRLPVLVVSNYSGGSLALFSISEDGSIRKQEDFVQFKGGSINKERQTSAHIHSAFFSADGQKLFVSDLGTDLIYVYRVNKNEEAYTLEEVERISIIKGAGPRHVVVTNGGDRLYVVLELTGEIAVYEQKNGGWVNEQVLPIYNKGFDGEQGAADVKMSSDGKFIYATNRGEANVIACYAIKKNGKLKLKSLTSTGGNSPRNLNFSPCQNWVFVTNQLSNNVMVFRRNPKNGALSLEESKKMEVSKPVCLMF